MSGGSFNYLCHATPDEILVGKRQDLAEMVAALSVSGAVDAAKETETIGLILNHFEARIQARMDRLSGVWKAMEWWRSGDWTEAQFKEALAEYRKDVEVNHVA